MEASRLLRILRQRSGLTLREVARRAETSHATVLAYEQGRVDPTTTTFTRMVHATGFSLEARPTRRVNNLEGMTRGEELEAVLRLAAAFPARHEPTLGPQRFGR